MIGWISYAYNIYFIIVSYDNFLLSIERICLYCLGSYLLLYTTIQSLLFFTVDFIYNKLNIIIWRTYQIALFLPAVPTHYLNFIHSSSLISYLMSLSVKHLFILLKVVHKSWNAHFYFFFKFYYQRFYFTMKWFVMREYCIQLVLQERVDRFLEQLVIKM